MANQLGRCKQYKGHVDLVILDSSGAIVGEFRIKPNKILWASRGQKVWRGKSLRRFKNFMKDGKKQVK
jgi:hypothetical protein